MKYLIAAVVGVAVVAVIVGYLYGVFAGVQIFFTGVLVIITAWYAWNTHKQVEFTQQHLKLFEEERRKNQAQQFADYFLFPMLRKLKMEELNNSDYYEMNNLFNALTYEMYLYLIEEEDKKLLEELKSRVKDVKEEKLTPELKEKYKEGIKDIIRKMVEKYGILIPADLRPEVEEKKIPP